MALDWHGLSFQEEAKTQSGETLSKSQRNAGTPTPEKTIGKAVTEALTHKEALLGGPRLSNIKVLWAKSQWSISCTVLWTSSLYKTDSKGYSDSFRDISYSLRPLSDWG